MFSGVVAFEAAARPKNPVNTERTTMTTNDLWVKNARNWLRTLSQSDETKLTEFEMSMKSRLKFLLGNSVDANEECWIKVGKGTLVFQSAEVHPDGTNYVRVLDENNEEIAYWDAAEWGEDPVSVMGAIMGALCALCGPNEKF